MVRPERFELPTFWFVARRSIQLSYGRMIEKQHCNSAGLLQGARNIVKRNEQKERGELNALVRIPGHISEQFRDCHFD